MRGRIAVPIYVFKAIENSDIDLLNRKHLTSHVHGSQGVKYFQPMLLELYDGKRSKYRTRGRRRAQARREKLLHPTSYLGTTQAHKDTSADDLRRAG